MINNENDTLVSNEIIKINNIKFNNEVKQSVSARELYNNLGLNKAVVNRWLNKNIVQNEFATEHEDWEGFNIMLNGNEVKDYAVSVEFAKKLCMMARTENGEKIRNYFIKCEKRVLETQQFKLPQNYKEALIELVASVEENERLAYEIEEKQDTINLISDTKALRVYKKNLRIECSKIVDKIVGITGTLYNEVWRDAYSKLMQLHKVDWKYEFLNAKNKIDYLANKDILYLKELKDILISFLAN